MPTVQHIEKGNIFVMIVSKYRIDANTEYFLSPSSSPSPSLLPIQWKEKSIFEKKHDDFYLSVPFSFQTGVKCLAHHTVSFLVLSHWTWQ